MNCICKYTVILMLVPFCLYGQEKRDFNWFLGGFSSGGGLRLIFKPSLSVIEYTKTNIIVEGSNTSMSDPEGNLLFYSNGCKIMNAKGELMSNGDNINPGQIQQFFCPSGGSPIRQGVIALTAPDHNHLYYVFNLDWDQPYLNTNYFGVAPQRLFYQVIDMVKDSSRGAVISKNQIAIQDTFARGNISAARHANGKDWWLIVPKSHTNCYFLIPVTAEGVQPAQLKCSGHVWTDDDSGAQATFSPDQKKYVRFNAWNGLNIYDFNNATGDLSKPVQITFPNDTINYIAGVAISPNSRFLYVCARKRVYQFDLQASNIESSKIQVAEWDGTLNPYATIFYLAALAPDGKIYISSTSSTLNLHVIEKPNCPGLSCQLVQRGVVLPAYNFATIPNFPHYRMSTDSCGTSSTHGPGTLNYKIYPNPTSHSLWVNLPDYDGETFTLHIHDLAGRIMQQHSVAGIHTELDVSGLAPGAYFYTLYTQQGWRLASGRFVRAE